MQYIYRFRVSLAICCISQFKKFRLWAISLGDKYSLRCSYIAQRCIESKVRYRRPNYYAIKVWTRLYDYYCSQVELDSSLEYSDEIIMERIFVGISRAKVQHLWKNLTNTLRAKLLLFSCSGRRAESNFIVGILSILLQILFTHCYA